ncbi:Response regulator containing a CheY-like receiver domain and an HTH DNA-binding domain (plasmid) [Rubrobacter radiotolerans]|uniref:Response regulator containing a CheY-like receiver domain and an HTH DNA-binding domain n=1 Tax=Rubrobacter radiotolerans TaxID=42256 RepID=A0A023X8P2_RUBRA|nr:response regulator transcription factor [Rubrobacter radiotolerans]AHY48414.1 Response regulator containing a CheY-like receiver domain and an HTH DNA-binding domain [Rubrobacter radiotolerans]MDX5895614.1 response regulator transcription factor [Rubrobacter radiotolerans]
MACASESEGLLRVVVTDDDPVTRVGIRYTLEASPEIEVVAEASTGREAVRLAERLRPDVVTLDLSMPEMDGRTAATEIKREAEESSHQVGVLVMTSYGAAPDFHGAMEAGADGYILKSSSFEELIRAVKTVATGASYLSRDVAPLARGETRSPRPRLTEAQRETLELAASGLTVDGIARACHVSPATVKYRLTNVYRKLGAANRAEAISLAHEHGLLDGP